MPSSCALTSSLLTRGIDTTVLLSGHGRLSTGPVRTRARIAGLRCRRSLERDDTGASLCQSPRNDAQWWHDSPRSHLAGRRGRRRGDDAPSVDGPAGRTLTAAHASQEDRAGFTPDTVIVSARQVASKRSPHGSHLASRPLINRYAQTGWEVQTAIAMPLGPRVVCAQSCQRERPSDVQREPMIRQSCRARYDFVFSRRRERTSTRAIARFGFGLGLSR